MQFLKTGGMLSTIIFVFSKSYIFYESETTDANKSLGYGSRKGTQCNVAQHNI